HPPREMAHDLAAFQITASGRDNVLVTERACPGRVLARPTAVRRVVVRGNAPDTLTDLEREANTLGWRLLTSRRVQGNELVSSFDKGVPSKLLEIRARVGSPDVQVTFREQGVPLPC